MTIEEMSRKGGNARAKNLSRSERSSAAKRAGLSQLSSIKKRDYASQDFLKNLEAAATKEERDQMVIAEEQHTVIAAMHRLEALMGYEEAKKWLKESYSDLVF